MEAELLAAILAFKVYEHLAQNRYWKWFTNKLHRRKRALRYWWNHRD